MPKINWSRLLIGAIAVAIIVFVTDGLMHEKIPRSDWKAIYDASGATPPTHQNIAFAYFAVFEIGRGFLTMFLYATMRTHFRPGPKTAALAGLVTWFAFSVTGPAQFIPLGFFSNALWLKAGAFQFVSSILAAIVGAVIYKDSTPHAA